MTVIICLDDYNGMAFNKRRQSRDSCVTEDLKAEFSSDGIKISPYSEKLFSAVDVKYTVCEDLASERDGVLFVETFDPSICSDHIHRLVIYRWNRHYPADLFCTLEPSRAEWKQVSVKEFCGTSHELITREIFEKTSRRTV